MAKRNNVETVNNTKIKNVAKVEKSSKSVKAQKRTDAMGCTISFAEVKLGKGEQACCCVK